MKEFEEIVVLFGNNVRLAREEQNMTQKRLAELSGVSTAFLRKIEYATGSNPTCPTMQRIADVLGTSIGELTEEPPREQHPEGERIGERERRLRLAREKSQKEIGAVITAADGHEVSISRLESGRGNATLKTIFLVCRNLGVPLGDLTDGLKK